MVSYKSFWFISAPKLWDSRPIGTSPASALITVADFHCGELTCFGSVHLQPPTWKPPGEPQETSKLKNQSVIFSKSTAKNLSGAEVRMAHQLPILLPVFQNFRASTHPTRCEKPPPGWTSGSVVGVASRSSFFCVEWTKELRAKRAISSSSTDCPKTPYSGALSTKTMEETSSQNFKFGNFEPF